ncbi:hypothetical protein [Prosthecobacter sp.]|uniref:hypothetical protein n=1 Tax=Prosthecobacter sp. TaxID=1965333 RepID=UPI003782FE33
MKRFEHWPLLPHEIAFGVFFGITLARLVPQLGLFSPPVLVYTGLIAAALPARSLPWG